MSDDESARMLRRLQDGDDEAARRIFDRYVTRLVALARSKMSPKLARKTDPEDVAMSAMRSFFRRANQAEFELGASGDLWRLLAAITVNKTLKSAERYGAAKRALDVEQSWEAKSPGDQASEAWVNEPWTREPTPEQVAALRELVEQAMQRMPPKHREMLELYLQGVTVEEIAQATVRTEHSVRRVLRSVRERLVEAFSAE